MKDFDITKTKLIIWDLDETFWDGVLLEEKVKFKPEVLNFIKELTLKGIMNSICSKNDFEKVKNEFLVNNYSDIWDLFVFPSIDMSPKGERIKEIIKAMNLREENVIFIDDNSFNINEAKFYCPKIMSAQEKQIPKLIEELYLVNEYDFKYTRLNQYKVLEKKARAKKNISNEDFLKQSGIKIAIKKDCTNHLDRIKTLIERTNQLNFTKNRENNIEKYFEDKNYDTSYIIVEDKFGKYGICGFYVLDKKENKLIHFLFSCRILNMGIEQFVYSYLKKPSITVIDNYISSLDKTVDWIELVNDISYEEKKEENNNDINILFKGPCDLYSSLSYINADCNIDTEFPYWNKKLVYILSHTHTAFIEQTNKLNKEELKRLEKLFPCPDEDEFKTNFFNEKYNLIFLSLLTSAHSGLYKNKKEGYYCVFGYSDCDITKEENWEFTLKKIPENMKNQYRLALKQFKGNHIFMGNPPIDTIIDNIKYILENIKGKLVLILGSEIPSSKELDGYKDMDIRHKKLNDSIKEFIKKENLENKIDLIELTDLIQDDNDYTTCINHFSRRVYLLLAQKIIDCANKNLGRDYLKLKADLH